MATTAFYNGQNDPAKCTDCSSKDTNADAIAWYCANAGSTTHKVGQKQANLAGFYDMAGNVWEWCHDRYSASLGSSPVSDPWGLPTGSDRALRGGSWYYVPNVLRAASRIKFGEANRDNDVGFRCARTR
jgi:formylglycine-generating enzyme required for sulfatase activity